jgi:hypothetical protein
VPSRTLRVFAAKKIPKVSMSEVETYIQKMEPWMQDTFNSVRMLILTFPEIKETFRYKSPFYDYKGMMLYMGPYKKKRFVLGFCNGNRMRDETGILKNDAGQTQIRHLEFFSGQPINQELLVEYIAEAMQVNEHLKEPQHVTTRKSRR